jgi:hypothetical protein
MIEFWEFLVSKYEAMVRNNSLYMVFINNIKSKIESIVGTYTNGSKAPYKAIASIHDELNNHNESFDSEDRGLISGEEIKMETESLVNAIDVTILSVEDTF